ncbi:MAG TPA: nitroreductase family protein [Roseiarcus sp.]|jgi:nitroreductase
MTEIGLFDAIYSARALRRLKPDPVPDEIITRILDAAIRAPSAGNEQNWAFIVVRDSEQRRRLGMIYRKASDIASEMYKARGRPTHMTDEQYLRMLTSGAYLWDHMGEAPVLLVACLHQRATPERTKLPVALEGMYEGELAYQRRIRGASIYPAAQNIILACRAFGLGTLITTNHIRCEDEVKALLGLPPNVSTYALMPIGYPQGKFGPLARKRVSEVAYADRWGVAWPS